MAKKLGRQWARIRAERKDPPKERTNAYFATKDEGFLAACERAGTPPTTRQASKYRQKKGRAWKEGRE